MEPTTRVALGLVGALLLTGLAAGHKYHGGACPTYEAMRDFDMNKVSERQKAALQGLFSHLGTLGRASPARLK